MEILVFEDEWVNRLDPATTGRPAFAVSCASFRLIDWLRKLDGKLVSWVRPHLVETVALDYPDVGRQYLGQSPWTLLVNARLLPSVRSFHALQEISRQTDSVQVYQDDCLLAAKVRSQSLLKQGAFDPAIILSGLSEQHAVRNLDVSLDHIAWPDQMIGFQARELNANLQYRIDQGEYEEIRDGVFARERRLLDDNFVADTRDGPVVMESGTRLGPFVFLKGPVHLDRHVQVASHSALKDGVAIGHTCKVGGEIAATTIESYTNKQHFGYLGHSYLGSWINFGAGTSNSDLKNTYGTIHMNDGVNQAKRSTGSQFVGCFVGDYAKTAILTSIFAGKRIGACSMVYGLVTTDVPGFSNYGRSFGKLTEVDPDVMVQTQARMFSRRNVPQRPCDIQLIHEMFELTRSDRRGLKREPMSF